jgi:hypothetical protein
MSHLLKKILNVHIFKCFTKTTMQNSNSNVLRIYRLKATNQIKKNFCKIFKFTGFIRKFSKNSDKSISHYTKAELPLAGLFDLCLGQIFERCDIFINFLLRQRIISKLAGKEGIIA